MSIADTVSGSLMQRAERELYFRYGVCGTFWPCGTVVEQPALAENPPFRLGLTQISEVVAVFDWYA